MVSYKSVTMRAAIFWWLQRIDVKYMALLIELAKYFTARYNFLILTRRFKGRDSVPPSREIITYMRWSVGGA